jgi:hypothetical protein
VNDLAGGPIMTADTTEARIVRLANLLVASGVLLICVGSEIRWEWAGSLPRIAKPDSWYPFREIIGYSVALTWFTGALGLLYRRRCAWIASLVGAGLVAGFFVYAVIELVWLWYYPNADLARLKSQSSGVTGAISYFFAFGAAGTFVFVGAAIAAFLFVGLYVTREQLLHRADPTGRKAV